MASSSTPTAGPHRRQPAAAACTAAALGLLLLLLALTAPQPASAHDWIGAKGTPDCECLPHFKLDCSTTAHVEKAWRTLVSRKCNATVATAASMAAGKKVELLVDSSAAGNKAEAAAGASSNATATEAAPAGAGAAAAEEHHHDHAGHDHDHAAVAAAAAPAAAAGAATTEEEPPPSRVYRCQVDQDCYEAFHVVIGHHYGCPTSFLPLSIAEGVHSFQTPASSVEADGATPTPDSICLGCFQPRYVKGVGPAGAKDKGPRPALCPKLNCHDSEDALLDAVSAAAEAGCSRDCSSQRCRELYQKLRVHHDGCILNDNPMPSRLAADLLRDACRAHECTFSNGTYAAGNYTVDCKRDKNRGPFRAPMSDLAAAAAGDKVPLDHSAHDHGAASTAPSNLPAAAKSGAMGATAVGGLFAAVAAVAAMVIVA